VGKIAIFGSEGAVGTALTKIVSSQGIDVDRIDLVLRNHRSYEGKVDILHIAIPWSTEFVDEVSRIAGSTAANIVVIHSTVPVGTTRELGSKFVHSPVRGQHDDLVNSLLSFKKYVAGTDKVIVATAARHLENLGLDVKIVDNPETTELAKLLCTCRYLNDLAFCQFADDTCWAMGVDPEFVLNEWTRSYNAGYFLLSARSFIRPLLTSPKGNVGGTCVLPNARTLKKMLRLRKIDDKFVRRALNMFEEES